MEASAEACAWADVSAAETSAPKHACTLRLLEQTRRNDKLEVTVLIAGLILLILVGLGFAWTRRQSPVIDES
ncbi:hypothetical protein DB30_07061 [Enhygromyxa salina]|uniref:Uncharacterized protein n=1 Tax=Enhygromyxa salina TaxID=215803 RepID=A0A0C1ZT67_9BACT|nr:hypothetical protein [Enhygromyxa salina]KIG14203.1 hypothetical protein DB30_07061 [Enhygromyxa salina]